METFLNFMIVIVVLAVVVYAIGLIDVYFDKTPPRRMSGDNNQ